MEKSSHSNVPKFASFRVKGKAEQPSGGKERRDGEHDNPRRNATVDGALGLAQESATTRSKTSNKRSEPLYQKSSSRDPRRPHEPGSRQALKRKFPELSIDRRNTSDRLFQVDTKGDPHNLVYGTIHRYNIPSYYRWGAGVVVGLPARLRIDRAMAEEFVVITDRDQSQARRRDKYPFARNERRHLRKLRIRDGGALPANDEMGQEFISLRLSGRSKTSGDEDDGVEVTGTDGDRDYRSIEGRAKTKAPVDADMEYATDTSTSDYEAVDIDALESSKKARHLELMQNVDKEPSRASRWLELIRHQDALLGSTNSARGRRPTEAERRSTADIKLSMYEKALIKVKKAAERYDELLIGLMDEGSKIWE
ncbi:MAG: hypothetical protein M1815_000878 [Lichina confinis]|nr:MAG: hypothetical protein M1815_000878 [Lichina confinis]